MGPDLRRVPKSCLHAACTTLYTHPWYYIFMTLNWSETAPDCLVAARFLPAIRHQAVLDDNYRWCGLETGKRLTVAKLGTILVATYIPDSPYWSRTRHRVQTAHGCHQIIDAVTRHEIAVRDLGWPCMCGTVCRYA